MSNLQFFIRSACAHTGSSPFKPAQSGINFEWNSEIQTQIFQDSGDAEDLNFLKNLNNPPEMTRNQSDIRIVLINSGILIMQNTIFIHLWPFCYAAELMLTGGRFRAVKFFSTHGLFQDFLEEIGNGWPVARSSKICLCNLFIICKFLKNSKLHKFIKFKASTSIRRNKKYFFDLKVFELAHCPWYC